MFAALEANGLPPDALELEITENIMLDQQAAVHAQATLLAERGVTLSLDDFGTGHASLNLLRDFPVSRIKVDKSFTQAVQTSSKDRAIVASIIDLASRLGLRVVAEGIERPEDCEFLRALGCEKGQATTSESPSPPAVFEEQFTHARARPLRRLTRDATAPRTDSVGPFSKCFNRQVAASLPVAGEPRTRNVNSADL